MYSGAEAEFRFRPLREIVQIFFTERALHHELKRARMFDVITRLNAIWSEGLRGQSMISSAKQTELNAKLEWSNLLIDRLTKHQFNDAARQIQEALSSEVFSKTEKQLLRVALE